MKMLENYCSNLKKKCPCEKMCKERDFGLQEEAVLLTVDLELQTIEEYPDGTPTPVTLRKTLLYVRKSRS
jgi:hypothetical protein